MNMSCLRFVLREPLGKSSECLCAVHRLMFGFSGERESDVCGEMKDKIVCKAAARLYESGVCKTSAAPSFEHFNIVALLASFSYKNLFGRVYLL